jgi:peptidoglycan/LPS O-acetylase OafA/YrhL
MGLVRIYLALSVLAVHAGMSLLPWPMHSGVEAVQIFFLISGFYMALISNKYRSAVEFYASRFLRIFIPYYLILSIVLFTCVVAGLAFGHWLDLAPYFSSPTERNGVLGIVLTAVSNLTVFFQDWVMFLEHDPGRALSFTTDFQNSGYPLYHYLLIQQAWTVGTELTFYLLVPWLSRLKTAYLLLIGAASLGLRIYTYQTFRLSGDPFNYRFFPFELALFVAGMIAYRVYAKTLAKRERLEIANLLQYLVYVAAILLFLHLEQQASLQVYRYVFHRAAPREYSRLITYAGWVVLIPSLYHLTRNLKVDRFIGELSYLVYLLHFVVVEFVDLVLVQFSLPGRLLGVTSAALTVAIAALLYLKFLKPFDERRPEFARQLAQRWSAGWKRMETRPGHSLGANPRE